MAKAPFGMLCADALSERTLKGALSALQPGPIRYRRNHVIACEGDSADYVFLVVGGVIRSCKTFTNGERAVVAFYLTGDLLGCGDEARPLSFEAAADAVVMLIKRPALMRLAASNARLSGFLRTRIGGELNRAQEHATTMSMSAKDRFLTFLEAWLKRSGSPDTVRIPMGYQDIADHLGIKIETLSRTITELGRSGPLTRSSSRRMLRLHRPLQ